ncbi:MAG: flippase [Clostridia bacterium]|nr:flippase [Clostridia bacterium]
MLNLNFLKNRTAKNAGWLIGGRVAQMIISFFVSTLTARYLGPANYGIINYAAAYTAFFTAFCTLGINSVLVNEFIDKPEDAGTTIGTTLVLRAVSSLLSAFTIITIVCFVDAGEPTTIAVVALCSIGVVFHIFETFNFWFQAQLKSKITAIVTFCAYIITAIYRVILLVMGKSVIWFAFVGSVDYICLALFLFIAYKKHGGKKLKFSWEYSKALLSRSYHFILSGLMVAVYGYTDKIMLKHMLGESEVGLYSIATTLCTMWCFVLKAIIDSMHPSVMEAYNKKDEALFERKNRQLYAIVFYVSIFVSVMFQIFAPLIIKILYGEAYMGSVNPLRIITWYTAFSYLGASRDAWIVCKGCQKYLKYIYFLAAVCNVTLNFVLIPLFGASGAAFASLIAQILISIVLPFFIKTLRPNSILMLQAIFLKGIRGGK